MYLLKIAVHVIDVIFVIPCSSFRHTHVERALLEIVFGAVSCYMLFPCCSSVFQLIICLSLLIVQLLCLYLGTLHLWCCMFHFQKKLLAVSVSRDFTEEQEGCMVNI